jgi:type VI secretion system secreted protein VgrG
VAGPPTQDFRLIKFRLDGSSDTERDWLMLEGFTGQEGISFSFHYDLSLLSLDKAIDFHRIIGQRATITVVLENKQERYINGIVTAFTQAGVSTEFTSYRATVRPDVWRLTRIADNRIFQNSSAAEIIETILTENHVVYEARWNAASYPKREYCVQYGETDSRFVSRLMEDEGILYWFEHDKKRHVMILGDTIPPDQTVPFQGKAEFRGISDPTKTGPGITAWTVAQELRPNLYTLRDFDFTHPNADLTERVPAMNVSPGGGNQAGDPEFEVYDFPGKFDTHPRGQHLTELRMEEIESGKVVIDGSSTCRAFISAHTFKLTGHYRNGTTGQKQVSPFPDFNRQYLITSIFHSFQEGSNFAKPVTDSEECEIYSNSFQCVPCPSQPKEFVYRPTRVTQDPVISGVQTATVVGPDSHKENGNNPPKPSKEPVDQIHTDKFGRVCVRFHWDRNKKKDGNTSCWIRVAQPWAHLGWGHQWIPRVGQEVVVTFLEGDPDRPLITGAVYNGVNELPFSTDHYKTQSGIRTKSNPVDPNDSADKYNMFRFDDKKNCEQVFLRSELRMDIRALGSYYETNGGDRHALVGWKNDKGQGGDFNITVGNDENVHIQGGRYERIEKKLNYAVVGDAVEDFEANLATMVKSKAELNAKQIIIEASEKICLKVGSSFILLEPSGVTIYGSTVKINSGGWGVETGDHDIDDPLDASPADTGKPGYVDCSKRGGGGGGHRRRHLSSQHSVSPPRAGEDARMSALRTALQNSAAGRHALEVYDRYGVTSSFTPGIGGGYNPNTNNMNLDPNWGDFNNMAFAHEMNHAQAQHEGTTPDISTSTRADYVDGNLREEAHSDALANQTHDELSQAGHAPTNQPANAPAYRRGYNQGVHDYQAAHPDATPEQADAAGRAAGEQAILSEYRAGRVQTSNTGQDYRQYYGNAWDTAHPAPPGGGGTP